MGVLRRAAAQADGLFHTLEGSRGPTYASVQNIPAIWGLLSCPLGFVTVEEPSSLACFVHFTPR